MKPLCISATRLSFPLAAAIAALLAAPATLADSATSAWTGGSTDWSIGGNWASGAPSASISALFNGTFGNSPQLTANVTAQGLELASGVGQDVILTGLTSAKTLNLTGTATLGSQANAGIMLDDTANHNLTVGDLVLTTLTNSTGFYVNNAGTLTLNGAQNLSLGTNTLTLGGSNPAGNILIAKTIALTAGALIVNTAGTVTLSGLNNLYSGGITLTAGTLNINALKVLGGVASTFAINGGTINNTSGAALTNGNANPITIGSNFAFTGTNDLSLGAGAVALGGVTRTITANAGTLTLGGIVSNGGLTKNGAGTLSLLAANTFSGGLVIKGGTVTTTTSSDLASLGAGTVTLGDTTGTNAATLYLNKAGTWLNPIILASNANHPALTLGTTTNNSATLTGGVTGTNNWTYANTSTGALLFSTGLLNNTGTITNASTGGGPTFDSIIGSNVTDLIQASATSTMTLSGTNSFSGSLYIKAGTVAISATTAASSGVIYLGDTGGSGSATLGSTINVGALPNNIVVPAGSSGTLSIVATAGGNNPTFAGSVTLNNNLKVEAQNNSGKLLTLSGAIGGTGNLILSSAGTGGKVTLSGSSINPTGTITNSGTQSGLVTISGPIGSNVTGVIQNSGTSNLVLSAANTAFTGDMTLTAGSLNLQHTNSLQNSVVNMNGGALTIGAGGATTITTLALGGLAGSVGIDLKNNATTATAVALTVGNSNSSYAGNTLNPTYSGALSNTNGSASLTKVGSNTQTLAGANTYSGATAVNGGTLQIASGGSINTSSAVTVAAGAKLSYNSSTALTVGVTLNGSGTSNRAVLGGSGTIDSALVLNNPGDTLAPGNSPGVLTFTPAQSWSSFSYDWEINNFTGTTAGTHFDQIAIANSLGLTGGSGSYTLNVLSLNAGNAAGAAPNFSEINRSWTILSTTAGISSFNAANWTINTAGFTNPDAGSWALGQSGNDLVLTYTAVPESRTAMLGGLGLLALLRRRRRVA